MNIIKSIFRLGKTGSVTDNTSLSDDAINSIRIKALKNEFKYLTHNPAACYSGIEVSEVSFLEFDRRKNPR